MNCIVAQSGGPTAAINASLAGVIKEAISSNKFDKVYGAVHGIQGVIKKHFLEMSNSNDEFIEELKKTPAMYLGSCRFKLPSLDQEQITYHKIFSIFEEYDIGAFYYIGGNDSMDTVDKLSEYADAIESDIRIIGVPKTIDNDLVMTDHTPGFGSAAKYIASSIREMAYDSYIYDLESVLIVEIMGRDAGWLTASSVLARDEFSVAPHLIYLPERAFDKDKFLGDLKDKINKYKNVVVAVSEGVRDAKGQYISASDTNTDIFGHVLLSGTGKTLEQLVKSELGVKVRSVEVNVLQRCAGHLTSATDINESFELGRKAVKVSLEGKTGVMVALQRREKQEYSCDIVTVPVSKVANEVKAVPKDWINDEGNDVNQLMIDYLRPLVIGETPVNYECGIPIYAKPEHLIGIWKRG